MPIDLTREQQEQLDRETIRPPAVRDPRSNKAYVLLPAEEYEQLREALEDDGDEQPALRVPPRDPSGAGWRPKSHDRPRGNL